MPPDNLVDKWLRIIKSEGVTSFLKRATYRIVRPFLVPYAIYRLQKGTIQIKNLEDLVELAFNFRVDGLNIAPAQIKEEILELVRILEKIKPRTILEIGTANGGTLFLFSRVVHPAATLISIDLPGGKFGGGYPKWKIPLYKSFVRKDQKIYLIRDDSHNSKTLTKVKNILKGKKVDFLFIDGDHSYKGVKEDFEMYSKLVERESYSFARYCSSSLRFRMPSRQILEENKESIQNKRNNFISKSNMGRNWSNIHIGGIIALHDIVPGPKEKVGGVPKFWKEIKSKYKTSEFVKDWNQGGYGIGVIFV
jgi:cephalosporin hydroxylase